MVDCKAWLDGAPCGLPIANEVENISNRNNHLDQNASLNANVMPVMPRNRRMSVAGSMLFSVNNQTQEIGFDHLQKVIRPSLIKSVKSTTSATSTITSTGNKIDNVSQEGNNTEEQVLNGSRNASDVIGCNAGNQTNSARSNQIKNSSVVGMQFQAPIGLNISTEDNATPATSGISGISNIPSMIHNDFDPFRRVPNPPFNLSGRPRSTSLDEKPKSWKPALATIVEAPEATSNKRIPRLIPINQAHDSLIQMVPTPQSMTGNGNGNRIEQLNQAQSAESSSINEVILATVAPYSTARNLISQLLHEYDNGKINKNK